MFLGEFVHSIDEKGRLTIPAKFRPELERGLVVTRGLDRCLVIYSLGEWGRMAERVAAPPLTDPRARTLRRLFFSSACDVVPDGQGRVVIPARLREYAGLGNEVIITGLYAYIEVWDPDTWDTERRNVEKEDAHIEEWAALRI